MAQPIPFDLPRPDPREALFRQLENAPQEHAEALLAAYQVLQGLHDNGVLEVARGALGSSDKILQIAVDTLKTPEAIKGLRNLIILSKIAGSIEPEVLEKLATAITQSVEMAHKQKPLGTIRLVRRLRGSGVRRVMTVMLGVLETLGRALGPEKPR